MATGIVAIAATLHGLTTIGRALFWLNLIFYPVLVALTVWRVFRYPQAFVADLTSHSRGVGFFTTVAASGVLGNQMLQADAIDWGIGLWVVTAVLWALVMYGVLAALTVREQKPPMNQGLNGGWLVAVVATQSLSILTMLIATEVFEPHRDVLAFASLVLWLGGGMVYVWLITLIFFRYTFLQMAPDDLAPPYWINMGAVAISTLAGTALLEHQALSYTLTGLAPFIKGMTLLFWAIGTWWIPMLLVLGVWRYLLRGFPFRYDPLYWGGVFPLGMYGVCTYHLAHVLNLPFLLPLSRLFLYVALIAWAATLAGLLDTLLVRLRRQAVPAGAPE